MYIHQCHIYRDYSIPCTLLPVIQTRRCMICFSSAPMMTSQRTARTTPRMLMLLQNETVMNSPLECPLCRHLGTTDTKEELRWHFLLEHLPMCFQDIIEERGQMLCDHLNRQEELTHFSQTDLAHLVGQSVYWRVHRPQLVLPEGPDMTNVLLATEIVGTGQYTCEAVKEAGHSMYLVPSNLLHWRAQCALVALFGEGRLPPFFWEELLRFFN